jgi:hypothetical protein
MKRIFFLAISIMFCFTLNAQSKPNIEWKEVDAYHDIMSPIFHSAEKGNFKTSRDSSSLLLDKAKLLKAGQIPKGLPSSELKPLTKRLVIESSAINEAVKSNIKDAELMPLLVKAHNTFHEIIEKYKEEKHEK